MPPSRSRHVTSPATLVVAAGARCRLAARSPSPGAAARCGSARRTPTPEARELFPSAYEPILQKLVDVLSRRLPPETVRELLLEAGSVLVNERIGEIRGSDSRQRLAEILKKLNGQGVGIEVVEESDKTVVRSCSCPVASVTAAHPELCDLFASLLGDILGATVRERCEKGKSP